MSAAAAEGLDHDEAPATPAELQATSERGQQVVLHDFPAGAMPGTLIHSVYEHLDFRREDEGELPRLVDHFLAHHGLDLNAHAESLCAGIAQTLETPLVVAAPGQDGPAIRLCELARSDRIDELEFLLPVGHASAAPGEEDGALTNATLAEVFERHRAPAAEPTYHNRLATLEFARLAGYLKGFVDLVFRKDGRYFVVDYKSNWLGNDATDYGPSAMSTAMAEHDYFLQYHLYVVALHRHLQSRLPDYDYARDFGGVFYLFLRGMAPQHAAGTGVFFDRPEAALVEDLSALLFGRGSRP